MLSVLGWNCAQTTHLQYIKNVFKCFDRGSYTAGRQVHEINSEPQLEREVRQRDDWHHERTYVQWISKDIGCSWLNCNTRLVKTLGSARGSGVWNEIQGFHGKARCLTAMFFFVLLFVPATFEDWDHQSNSTI